MHSTILGQACLLSIFTSIESYVLLAANLDDFKTLAKQFIPDKIADQLVKIVTEPSLYYKEQTTEREITKEEGKDTYEDESTDETSKEHGKISKKANVDSQMLRHSFTTQPPVTVDIDEIVDEVKKRLEKEYKLKPVSEEEKHNKEDEETDKEEISQLRYDSIVSKEPYDIREINGNKGKETKSKTARIPSQSKKKQKNIYGNNRNDDKMHKSEAKNEEPNQEDFDMFQKVSLVEANDSYEDYVTPAKDDIPDRAANNPKVVDLNTENETASENFKAASPVYYDEETTIADNIKARTEDLNYDYPEQVHTDKKLKFTFDATVKATDSNKAQSKKEKGMKTNKVRTMIPTLEHYKMSSPNYYAKIPVVAEKYDFDEPLPERDREEEDLKPIGNPPARINKKVKI